MACDTDDFDKNLENLKTTVRTSFARIYASLKARELKTLRQLDALSKQCQDDRDLTRNCVQEIRLIFDNETALLDNIYNYGAIDLEKLNFDSKTFSLEDYVKPEDDHMYLYKTIEEATKETSREDLEIEEAALKQITAANDCVCFVNIKSEDVSQKFRDLDPPTPVKCSEHNLLVSDSSHSSECPEIPEEEKSFSSESDPDVKKLDPTDDWMNSIKNQTETEPTQVTDIMEHSTITCS
ncbi:Uncharacterized protein OBRU01_07039 [Operophtera brumata]|uniref:Uncharacterized protein n=1 Tax=Operophtera brumata TaxID=104452 RepID=A0A0L7LJV1_OPEBR|nr:Uncharacterized protein OBRU01_07039 [Operophtera brumata]